VPLPLPRSDRYYDLSETRFNILESCKTLRRRLSDSRFDVADVKALAASMVERWDWAEGSKDALQRLFPELFA
jgi:hypothetical protein